MNRSCYSIFFLVIILVSNTSFGQSSDPDVIGMQKKAKEDEKKSEDKKALDAIIKLLPIVNDEIRYE